MRRTKYPEIKEILFLRGEINYTEFHLVNGKKVLSSTTLLRHQERLEGFLRVNKSHLVNPGFIKKMDVDGAKAQVVLNDGNSLKVSRRRIDYVKMNLL